MGTRQTKITVHSVPVDISEESMGAFFVRYGPLEVSSSISKSRLLEKYQMYWYAVRDVCWWSWRGAEHLVGFAEP